MTKIIAGNSCKILAQRLSHTLGFECLDANIQRFADQELRIQLDAHLYQTDVIIVQSTCQPANDHLMALLLLVDAAKRAGAQRIIAVIPYFGYSRQDRPSYQGGPISARLVATLLESAGVDHMITLDLHSKQAEGFFNIGVQNIDPNPLFASVIDQDRPLVVVSPDIGGLFRARGLANLLNSGIAIINKSRSEPNTCQMDGLIGNVVDKHCIIVDDIADTGGTLCQAAVLLKDQGALSVEVMVTHPVLSGKAIAKMQAAPILKIMTTASIRQKNLPKLFSLVDIIPLLAAAVHRVIA